VLSGKANLATNPSGNLDSSDAEDVGVQDRLGRHRKDRRMIAYAPVQNNDTNPVSSFVIGEMTTFRRQP